MSLTVHERLYGDHARPAPTLPSPALSGGILDSQSAALYVRLHHIIRLRRHTQHSMSTASTQAGRAGKARNQSAHMRAAWGRANARAGGQYMRVRGGYGSPAPITRLLGDVVVETGRRGRSRQPANAARMP